MCRLSPCTLAAAALILLVRPADGQLLRGEPTGPAGTRLDPCVCLCPHTANPIRPDPSQPNSPQPTDAAAPVTTALAPQHRLRGQQRRQLPSAVSFGFAANEGRQEPDAEVAPGADLQTPEHHHRALPPMSHGWALEANGGNDDNNKQQADAQQPAAAEPQHRVLPPMSHGWALENGPAAPPALGLVEEEGSKQLQAEATKDAEPQPQPQHRVLPPVSHGWALENGSDKQAEAQQPQQQQDGAHRRLPPVSHGWTYEGGPGSTPAPPALELAEEGGKQQQEEDGGAQRLLPPMSHGWALEGNGGNKQEEAQQPAAADGAHRSLEEGVAAAAVEPQQPQQQEAAKAPTEDEARRGPACVFGGLC